MKIDLKYDLADAHVHIGQDSIIGKGVSADSLLNYVRKHGLKQILAFSSDLQYQHYNRVLEDLLQHHKEIYGLVKVSLDYDQKETFRLLSNPKFIGIKFHPSLDRVPVTHKKYVPLFKHLEKIGKIALVHCGRWQEVASLLHTWVESNTVIAKMLSSSRNTLITFGWKQATVICQ